MNTRTPSVTSNGELQARSIDAIVSLLKALDGLHSMEKVVQHALLIVSGQLLVKRAAVFILEDNHSLRLQSAVGISRKKVDLGEWVLSPQCRKRLSEGDVMTLEDDGSIPTVIAGSFERVAHLVNGDVSIGLLLLGESLGKHSLDEQDHRLFETMGAVIGTMMHRAQVQNELIEARRRSVEAEAIRKSVMDHVSHEFNTPLLVVKGTGDLLRLASGSDRDELLNMQEQAVQRLEHLVMSIMRVASESKAESRSDMIPVSRLIDAILRPWIERETDGQCSLLVQQVKPGISVTVDPMRIEIILKELYCNAREAVRGDRCFIVVHLYCAPAGWWNGQDHTKRLELYRQQLDDHADLDSILWAQNPPPALVAGEEAEVVLEMIDLGTGIPTGEMELVFEPFSQAGNSTSLGVRGAGLGLPTCDKMARELGGQMAVQSTEGLGSIFVMLLPGVTA